MKTKLLALGIAVFLGLQSPPLCAEPLGDVRCSAYPEIATEQCQSTLAAVRYELAQHAQKVQWLQGRARELEISREQISAENCRTIAEAAQEVDAASELFRDQIPTDLERIHLYMDLYTPVIESYLELYRAYVRLLLYCESM